ncbi:type I secretion C-terminal target domain-containing protein [Photobacterium aquimaris]|uniref:Type I secretion C-terminal target domain-containing protein n=1 Tax=Photobacterium aquimaris TaxID=512643 RepID=A0A2T3HU03_9GAMM|nr:type I secretion C-terminal target domain-containing protein [Photobacterium aquimaris]
MYIVVEGVIWKITAEGEWIQIPPSAIIDSSVPFISEKAQVNDIIKTKNNEDDVVKISTSETTLRHNQNSPDSAVTSNDLSSDSVSFVTRVKPTLAETLPEAGFNTRPTTSEERNERDEIGDTIPSLRNSAALTVTIIDGGDGYENQFEVPTVDLFGDAIDVEDGRIVVVTITDINGKVFTASAVVKDQKWFINDQDLSELSEGPLDVYASVTDYYGNFVDATDDTIKDTLAEITAEFDGKGDNYLNQFEIVVSDLLGDITFVENNQPVTITVTDSQGKTITFETTNNDGAWNISATDLSSLAEGELTVIAETIDIAGNPVSATDTIIKDTLADITANFEGNGDNYLNRVEIPESDLFGSVSNVEDGQTVTIKITDSNGLDKSFTTTVIDGKWTIENADLTDLAEGELTILAETVDIAGNPASATNTIIKDTLADINANFDGKGDEYLNRFEIPVTDLFGNVENVEDGQSITITITDSNGLEKIHTTTVINGKWTIEDADLTDLAEGELTVIADTVDIAGNPVSATDTIIKDTLADISANFEDNGDEYLNEAEITAKTKLFGNIDFVENNQNVDVTVTDKDGKTITFATTVVNGAWVIEDTDLATFADGELIITAETMDIAGNPAIATNTIIKDTSALSIDIVTDNYELGGLNIVALKNGNVTFLEGTTTGTQAGDKIEVTFSDGTETIVLTTTVDSTGNWRIEDFDLNQLNVLKTWEMSATVTDAAGNTALDDMPTLTRPDSSIFYETTLEYQSSSEATSVINIEFAEFTFNTNQSLLEQLTSQGNPITVTVSSDGLTLTAESNGVTVLTATIQATTQTINITLFEPIDTELGSNSTQSAILIDGIQTDTDGTTETVVAPALIYIRDSEPDILDDNSSVIEGNITSGNVLNNDSDLDAPLSVVRVTINGETKDLKGPSVTFDLPEGQLTIKENGHWIFTANRNLDHSSGDIDLMVSYIAGDKDYDYGSADLTITIKDGEANTIINNHDSNVEGLISNPTDTFTGDFTIKAGSDNPDPNSITFNAQTIAALTALKLQSGDTYHYIEYTLSSDGKTITATSGGETIFTLTLTGAANGDDVTGTVTLVQHRPLNHTNASDVIKLPLLVDATDLDGTKTPTGQFDWYIQDGADPELIVKQELAFDEANLSSSQPISKTGTIDVVVGSDGLDGTLTQSPLFFDQTQLPSGLTSGGDIITYTVTGTGQMIEASVNGEKVFDIAITHKPDAEGNSTVEYTFNLYKSIDQTDPSGIETITIPVFIRDNDGDVNQANITVTIADGDTPVITDTTLEITENPIAVAPDAPPAGTTETASSTISVTAGQDPIVDLQLALTGAVQTSDGDAITHNGEALTWQFDGNNTYDAVLANGTVIFSINLSDIGTIAAGGSADATITIVLNDFIDHLNGKDTKLDITLPVQATDSDGSVGTSNVTVTIWDGLKPEIIVNGSLNVQENDLLDDGVDSDASDVATPTLSFNTGSDSVVSVTLDTALFNGKNYTSAGDNITLGAPNADGWYIATAAGKEIFQIKVNLDGTVEFDLFASIDHPDTTSQDTLNLEFGAILTDSDGDTSPATIFDVNVLDDVPKGGTDGTLVLVEGQSQTLKLLTDEIIGADGGEIVSFIYNGTTYSIDGNPINLINTTVTPAKKYGTMVVNADGTIEITTVSTSEFSGQILDSLTYTVKDGDGDTADRTATMALGDNPGHIKVELMEVLEDTRTAPLSIKVFPGDEDQNETLTSITISESSLAGGQLYLNGTLLTAVGGVITITDFIKNGNFYSPNGELTYQPAPDAAINQQGMVNIEITATISTNTADKTLDKNLPIKVYPNADAPVWDETKDYEYTGVEDDNSGIKLDLAANLTDTDSSEKLTYRISGIPDGITLKLNGNIVKDGDVLNQNQLNKVTVVSDKNLAGKFEFTVTAIATEKGNQFIDKNEHKTEEIPHQVIINIKPDADTPTLSVKNIKGIEDQPINLSQVLIGKLTDTDGSESLSYQIKVQEGWLIQGGGAIEQPVGSGIYIVSAEDIENGSALLYPKEDISSWTETLTIEVTAVSTETSIDGLDPVNVTAVSDTKIITIDLKGVIDHPDVADGGNGHWEYVADSTDNSTGFKGTIKGTSGFNEDSPLPLDFMITTSDDDKSEQITIMITNLPDGVMFVDSNGNPITLEIVGESASTGVIYQITNDQLKTTFLQTTKDFSGQLNFDVNVISTEPDGDSGEFNYQVEINVLPVVDEKDGAVLEASTHEDKSASLLIEPVINKDIDHSESLTGYKITGLPEGLTLFIDGIAVSVPAGGLDLAGYKNSGESWANFINSGRVTVLADEDLSGLFTIPISYEVTDTSPTGQKASKDINATIQLDVAGIVEGDTRLESTSEVLTSTDGSPIDLTNTVHFFDEDLDGSEYLDYIIIVVPSGINLIVEHPNGASIDGSGNWIIPATGLTSDTVKEAMKDILAGATISSNFDTDIIDLRVVAHVIDDEHSRYIDAPLQVQITGHGGGGSCLPIDDPDNIQSDDAIIAKEGEDIDLSGLLDGNIDDSPEIEISFFIDIKDLPLGVEIEGDGVIPEYNAIGEILGYTITPSGLENMVFVGLDEDWAGCINIPIEITQTSTCNGQSSKTTQNIKIEVIPVVDDIIVNAGQNTIQEDTESAINLELILGDNIFAGQTISGEGELATGKETINWLTITLPAGAKLNGDPAILQDNGDNTWTIKDPTRLGELTLTPPLNFSGELTMNVAANITDKADCPTQTDTQTKTASVVINVAPVTDFAEMPDKIEVLGDEDSYINITGLDAILFDNDGSETLSLNISGLPEGAVLFYSPDGGNTFLQLPNSGQSWSISASQMDGVYIRPPLDFSGDMKLKLEAITNEIGTNDIKTSTTDLVVGVKSIGDDVQFFDVPESLAGTEGDSFTIPVNLESYETNSDEALRLTVTISANDPAQLQGLDKIVIGGQEVTFGQKGNNWFATVVVNANTLDEFTLYPGDAYGDMTITLEANTVDTNIVLGTEYTHEGVIATEEITLTIDALPDEPELTAQYTSIIAETNSAIALNLDLMMQNPAPNEKGTIMITGFPSDYVFSAGKEKDGGWEVDLADIANLTMTGNSAQDFTLSIEPSASIGNQTATGTAQSIDFKVAEAGDNTLVGTANDDLIIGGKGNDIMSGDAGNDSFVFKSDDLGSISTPAQDTILDFDTKINSDNIDLSAILSNVTDGISADNYIDITENNGSVTLHVKDNSTDVTQEITLDNVSKDALYGADTSSATEAEVLQKMIDDNNLITG